MEKEKVCLGSIKSFLKEEYYINKKNEFVQRILYKLERDNSNLKMAYYYKGIARGVETAIINMNMALNEDLDNLVQLAFKEAQSEFE
ncbi:MAG: hypothetical protein QHH15_00385 [Candidatus Thermoplasmatota archaeon]|nr:hypothetical protein [Candidatus Thermoplasmatota archaeon]MDH7506231.1 hypothetical protein [Candidatus Thermoplasmatota archaeon]